ncbi:hypothetical protein SEVIR_5G331750v4 [Setaria viridis]
MLQQRMLGLQVWPWTRHPGSTADGGVEGSTARRRPEQQRGRARSGAMASASSRRICSTSASSRRRAGAATAGERKVG